MGLRITRMQKSNPQTPIGALTSTSSVWSARDLCPNETLHIEEPMYVERVVPDADRHLSSQSVAGVFDRVWKIARKRSKGIVELNMMDVNSVDARFARELGYFLRQNQKRGVMLRLTNWNDESHGYACTE